MTSIVTLLIAAAVGIASCTPFSAQYVPAEETPALSGKAAAFVGDSVCAGTNYEGGYAGILAAEENMTVTNAGRGGASITRNIRWSADGDGIRPCIIDMTASLEGEYDYIIIEGGINDFWNHAPLGALTDGGSFEGGFDDETFAGALETIFFDMRTQHPESKVGYVIIHDPFTYDAEEAFEPYYEMIKSACDKWSVPYLDLYSQNNQTAGVNVRDAWQKEQYFGSADRPQGDGTHPNELGYRTIYTAPMKAWLESL